MKPLANILHEISTRHRLGSDGFADAMVNALIHERQNADTLANELRTVVAWTDVIETCAPELGGAVKALWSARAALAAYETK